MTKKETHADTNCTYPVEPCRVFRAVATAVAALCCTREGERMREREREKEREKERKERERERKQEKVRRHIERRCRREKIKNTYSAEWIIFGTYSLMYW